DYSRRTSPPRATYDINQLLRESVELMSNELRGHEIRVQFDLMPHLPRVFCDSIQIGQVIVNLLANARDVLCHDLRAEKRLILVSARPRRGEVLFAVEDPGPGVPEELVERLFEPFVTTKPNGMGIGLNICQNIVREHGGRITYQRTKFGSRFEVAVPSA